MWDFHGSLTYSEFLVEWFGLHAGRELGDPDQHYTNNPTEIIGFVRECKKANKPAFMSVTPRKEHNLIYGVDRIFFDFDAHKPKQKDSMTQDTKRFISNLRPIKPFITKTFHGYHINLFFKEGCIRTNSNIQAKEFYVACQNLLLNGNQYKRLCKQTLYRVKGLARIPLSWHESGGWVTVVDEKLEPTKIRGLDYYRMYGLDNEFVERAVRLMGLTRKANAEREKNRKVYYKSPPKGVFKIRPCFEYALEQSEMDHHQRLALVGEAFWAGKTPQQIKDLFKKRRDYREDKTDYQVDWLLNKLKQEKMPPYRCETMIGLGWCIKSRCPIWNRKFKQN